MTVGTLARSPRTAPAPGVTPADPVATEAVDIVLTFESGAGGQAAALAVAARLPACCRVTVVAIPAPSCRLASWAPLTGLVAPGEIRAQAVAAACAQARAVAAALPASIAVRHQVSADWRHMPGGIAAHVIAATEPSRRRDRLALRRRANTMEGIPWHHA
jgi:hypothetical protein